MYGGEKKRKKYKTFVFVLILFSISHDNIALIKHFIFDPL